ncbi:heme-binding protein [Poseidonocella sp. HB161398]|uniref:heme-binding protein n=1 Tax=Poseidonocella sp. HB161398 TaxID=2320855 RepID=UPI001108CEA5|nr:heme-binding protein [Poseidonocella sp. HB161398]
MKLDLTPATLESGMRSFAAAAPGDTDKLGLLSRLPGKWINEKRDIVTGFEGRGWNMIALPFKGGIVDGVQQPDYRVLANQYNETLDFVIVDGPVANRGVEKDGSRPATAQTDQKIFALDYQQLIVQIAAGDSPCTTENIRGRPGSGIHHEPGFLLWISDQNASIDYTPVDGGPVMREEKLKVARLASIPHGDAVTAMGVAFCAAGGPAIPKISGLPVHLQAAPGQPDPALTGYLAPYAGLSGPDAFKGILQVPTFDVSKPWELLEKSIASLGPVKHTTTLHFRTDFGTGGIVNTPFIVKEANATEMEAIFWIMELEKPLNGRKWVLAYIQNVLLDFFPLPGSPDRQIRWPHVSINVMCLDEAADREKIATPACSHASAD